MAICMDYIKSGEVLIAPRLDYKYQYLLKCSECEECYCLLGPFITHCASHYDRDTSVEVKCPIDSSQIASHYERDTSVEEKCPLDSPQRVGHYERDTSIEEKCPMDSPQRVDHYERETSVEDKYPIDPTQRDANDDGNYADDFGETDVIVGMKLKIEPAGYITDEDPLTYVDQEYITDNEELEIKDEVQCKEDSKTNLMVNSPIDESMETEQITEDADYTVLESGESDDDDDGDEDELSVDSSNSISIRNFMQSQENIIALIDAYKHQPKLWNNNLPTQVRKSQERTKCMQEIATDIQNELDLQMTTKQVSRIIVQLRCKYRVILESEKVNGKGQRNQKDAWLYEHLNFLKPFLENNPISVLDSHPHDLLPEQILQILDIYKRYPQLWNSDTMEFCCKGKRADALVLMKTDLEMEMDLEVNENTLKKYLHCVHVYFSRQKRRDMGIIKTKEPRYEYYDHMMFLYDYLGPFKCPQCKRHFQSPLQLKAHKHQHDGSLSLKCPECKKGFKSVDPYMAHVRRHMNDLGVECEECGKGFLRMADLKIHMRAHTGAKPFFCDVCGASFRHSQAFNVHRRRHVKQYSQYCQICSKGCYTKNELNNHMRTHRDIREFVCVICGKAFKTKKTMQQHTFIHEEGRNHGCRLCGKMFKNKIGLGHHLKTHSKNTTLSSELNNLFY